MMITKKKQKKTPLAARENDFLSLGTILQSNYMKNVC